MINADNGILNYSPMDHIFITELKVDVLVGVHEWERAAPQSIQLDIQFSLPGAKSFTSDKIRDTVDYSAVVTRVRETLAQKHFNLIEVIAETVAQLLLSEFKVQQVKVRVAKSGMIKGVKQVGVEIERSAKK
jgi:7,8-dihydroneopterin aldolase/epimerase/oxygenase